MKLSFLLFKRCVYVYGASVWLYVPMSARLETRRGYTLSYHLETQSFLNWRLGVPDRTCLSPASQWKASGCAVMSSFLCGCCEFKSRPLFLHSKSSHSLSCLLAPEFISLIFLPFISHHNVYLIFCLDYYWKKQKYTPGNTDIESAPC